MSFKIGKKIVSISSDNDKDLDSQFLKNFWDRKCKTSYWRVNIENFGWKKLNGHKYVKANNIRELLSKVLPNTDCNFNIFNYGPGFAIQNYHHDSPTGDEKYYVTSVSETTYEVNV